MFAVYWNVARKSHTYTVAETREMFDIQRLTLE
jgi:hypothetical protein